VRNLFEEHFELKVGTRVYVPTEYGRNRGYEIKSAIEDRWRAPDYYFHLHKGGHVAAAKLHREKSWLASVDLLRFFDQITRQKIHRSLKRLNFSHAEAWEMACDSTVDKSPPQRRFSAPFGFVQSPLVSSLVLSHSALGGAIRGLRAQDVQVSVYMDDITVSGDSEVDVRNALSTLQRAAIAAQLELNEAKQQLPDASVTNFNIAFGSGVMRVTEKRMDEFHEAFDVAGEYARIGIHSYVFSVNGDQAAELL
jgi:hypothetical protein